MTRVITDRQVYDAVRKFTQEHGYAPNLRELAAMVGVKAISTVRVHLVHLKRDGYVTWTEFANRTVRIISEWGDAA